MTSMKMRLMPQWISISTIAIAALAWTGHPLLCFIVFILFTPDLDEIARWFWQTPFFPEP